jgi:hypothetical protein
MLKNKCPLAICIRDREDAKSALAGFLRPALKLDTTKARARAQNIILWGMRSVRFSNSWQHMERISRSKLYRAIRYITQLSTIAEPTNRMKQ